MEPLGTSPAEFKAFVDAEMRRWTPVVRAAKIKIDTEQPQRMRCPGIQPIDDVDPATSAADGAVTSPASRR